MTVLIECFHLQNETLVSGVQDMSQKMINRESYKVCRFVGNSHVYQAPKSNCFNCCSCNCGTQSTVQCINIEWCSKHQYSTQSTCICTMFYEIVQYLKFFMFFPGVDNDVSVIMMTSSSKFCPISWRGWSKSWLRPWLER